MIRIGITKNKANLRTAARTSSGRLHVIPTKNGWAIKIEGSARYHRLYSSQNEAINKAKSIVKKSPIIIHKKDGTIEYFTEN